MDDGSRAFLLVETLCPSTVLRVWGGDGFMVAGSPPPDTAPEGNRRETALGYHVPQRIAIHL